MYVNSFISYALGVSPDDLDAHAAGLPRPDSINMWPYLSGEVQESPRNEFWSGSGSIAGNFREGETIVQAYTNISSGFELLVGVIGEDCWQSPFFPNGTGGCGHPGTC